jgi:hypothetical protein
MPGVIDDTIRRSGDAWSHHPVTACTSIRLLAAGGVCSWAYA